MFRLHLRVFEQPGQRSLFFNPAAEEADTIGDVTYNLGLADNDRKSGPDPEDRSGNGTRGEGLHGPELKSAGIPNSGTRRSCSPTRHPIGHTNGVEGAVARECNPTDITGTR